MQGLYWSLAAYHHFSQLFALNIFSFPVIQEQILGWILHEDANHLGEILINRKCSCLQDFSVENTLTDICSIWFSFMFRIYRKYMCSWKDLTNSSHRENTFGIFFYFNIGGKIKPLCVYLTELIHSNDPLSVYLTELFFNLAQKML